MLSAAALPRAALCIESHRTTSATRWSWWSRDGFWRDVIELKKAGIRGQFPASDFLLAFVWAFVGVLGSLARYLKVVPLLDSVDTHSDGTGACAFVRSQCTGIDLGGGSAWAFRRDT